MLKYPSPAQVKGNKLPNHVTVISGVPTTFLFLGGPRPFSQHFHTWSPPVPDRANLILNSRVDYLLHTALLPLKTICPQKGLSFLLKGGGELMFNAVNISPSGFGIRLIFRCFGLHQ